MTIVLRKVRINRMFHYLCMVLKISLFFISFSHDPVIRKFHCFLIALKISLFSMSSSHDPVIRMFRYLFIALKISLFSTSSSHNPVIRMFNYLLMPLKSHFSPCMLSSKLIFSPITYIPTTQHLPFLQNSGYP